MPRRVNPYYRKEVTITNVNNPHDEHVIEFVANNVDRHNISFHSLFYSLALLRPAAVHKRARPAHAPIFSSSQPHGPSANGTASLFSHGLGAAMGGASLSCCASMLPPSHVGGAAVGAVGGMGLLGDGGGTAAAAEAAPTLGELAAVPPDQCRVEFDDLVARCASVRAFGIHNTSSAPLRLRLYSPPSHVGRLSLWTLADPLSLSRRVPAGTPATLDRRQLDPEQASAKRELLLDRLEERAPQVPPPPPAPGPYALRARSGPRRPAPHAAPPCRPRPSPQDRESTV